MTGKKKRGRPSRIIKGIPDTLERVAQAVLKTRPKAERDGINQLPPG